jgi:hypothetical protein
VAGSFVRAGAEEDEDTVDHLEYLRQPGGIIDPKSASNLPQAVSISFTAILKWSVFMESAAFGLKPSEPFPRTR